MKNGIRIFGSLVITAVLFASNAVAQEKIGSISISHPWARATPAGAKVGGGYVTIRNNGAQTDRLTGVTLSAADHADIHEMKMDGGVMKMRPLPEGLQIKPGETVKLSPEGYHLMFMGLHSPLKQGESIKGRLTFEKAGPIDVEFKVESVGAKMPTSDHMNMKMDKAH